jgi:5-methylcytosine-specific restriction endonuclease McrA
MSTSWSGGSTRQWRRIRAAVLEENQRENGGRCVLAIKDVCTGKADCVHHTLGRAVTGDDRRYLVAACRACNLHVGQPTQDVRPLKVSKW